MLTPSATVLTGSLRSGTGPLHAARLPERSTLRAEPMPHEPVSMYSVDPNFIAACHSLSCTLKANHRTGD